MSDPLYTAPTSPIRRVTRFVTSDNREFDTVEAASAHETERRLCAWLEARMPIAEVPVFAKQLTEDFVLTPRKGWIA